ncbi:TatD family deoxyribonuclease [Chlorobium phaeovibrioides]|uniref:TatD family deoxyribonuclease n=1 Tax=Chlorobium phaeovibrioides TaxID=1094 RepID=A0A5M8I9N7_CHLPH|nr:TatD family hydrolase [Chlorobium phaeovibrioides]KAA6232186.1 TatD family deoxyribonuclease [Chlorobium phaeovibrioides]MWV54660.1 YchF/TatD family DNA exonuclease [Chlorobium phaeovibrioides]RTY34846.1 TatD family deoxyribonuclease [Chlorobium phaeovibrioides]
MFADAHCHLSFPAFDEDRPAVIERMKEAGVTLLIDPGVNAETSRTSIDLARKHSFIHANVGLHPHDADSGIEAATFDELQQLARYPEVVAIGEIGLDYHYPETSPENQQEAFRTMLRMARSLNLPVVIHSRDAWQDTLRILDEEHHSALRGVMHCFSGDLHTAQECIKRGFRLSIPGTLTYKRSTLPEVVRAVPLESLLTETDSPYLAPVPFRGKRNEPAHAAIVARTIAEIREIPVEKAAEAIMKNTASAFNLDLQ